MVLANKLPNTESMVKLRKSLEPFLQVGSCTDVTPKLMKCRECKLTRNQRSKKLTNIFCRFYAFRRSVTVSVRHNVSASLCHCVTVSWPALLRHVLSTGTLSSVGVSAGILFHVILFHVVLFHVVLFHVILLHASSRLWSANFRETCYLGHINCPSN